RRRAHAAARGRVRPPLRASRRSRAPPAGLAPRCTTRRCRGRASARSSRSSRRAPTRRTKPLSRRAESLELAGGVGPLGLEVGHLRGAGALAAALDELAEHFL